jgi:hypothetical protein
LFHHERPILWQDGLLVVSCATPFEDHLILLGSYYRACCAGEEVSSASFRYLDSAVAAAPLLERSMVYLATVVDRKLFLPKRTVPDLENPIGDHFDIQFFASLDLNPPLSVSGPETRQHPGHVMSDEILNLPCSRKRKTAACFYYELSRAGKLSATYY